LRRDAATLIINSKASRVSGVKPRALRRMVRSRSALEGLTIERTVAAALRAPNSHAGGVHRRGARAARRAISHLSCAPPRVRGAPEVALAQALRTVKQSAAVTVLT
jgi:hypothetical protein